MPWEQPLQQVLESVQGPVAKVIAVIIIITTGLTLAFGDTAGGFRRLIQIIFGLSIAFAASSFFLTFFQFAGGAVIAMPQEIHDHLAGFTVPLHRSLTEPLLLGGAPRALAILIGTVAAAVALGLQLWIPGAILWIICHPIAVWTARKDPHFVEVLRRHIRYPAHLSS
jgi:type IV secretion system protein VirB2